jgi:colanic acid/amylovoran biosynthesis glycosyltransferase
MKLVYITRDLPHGSGEAFLIPEIQELLEQGHELLVVPFKPSGPIVHRDVIPLMPHMVVEKLISISVLMGALAEFLGYPLRTMAALKLLLRSRTFVIFIKNAVTVPKALWLSRLARRFGAEHIHAHWGGCSATMSMVASEVSNIPWSFTLHSWELNENNLLRNKVERALFTRTVSQIARARLRRFADEATPIHVIHVGVDLPAALRFMVRTRELDLRLVVVATLIKIKGIDILIEAWELLRRRGTIVRIDVVGDGPLRQQLETTIASIAAGDHISFQGLMSHDLLLSKMSSGQWDALVLPSIVMPDGEQEGIPMCLVEAMARGLPVVATETGGIPELLKDGAGILVPPNNPGALADSFQSLQLSPNSYFSLQVNGRKRVEDEFAVDHVVRNLIQQIETGAAAQVGKDVRPSNRRRHLTLGDAESSRIERRSSIV